MNFSHNALSEDVLVNKAVLIKNSLRQLPENNEGELTATSFEDIWPLQFACEACIDMGIFFIESRNLGKTRHVPDIFEKLVEHKVIELSLSRRLLSMISFGKMLRQSGRFRGKKCCIYLKKKQVEDLHTFVQQLLLA